MPQLSQPQVAALLLADGADVTQATYFTAIEDRESHGNSEAHNGVPPDNSYGLFQINMIGTLGPARRAQFGITDNAQLFDPATSVRAAKITSNGFRDLSPWRVPGGTPLTNTNVPAAALAVQQATSGNVELPPSSTQQTPGSGVGQAPAGGDPQTSFQLKMGTIAGQDIGPTIDKATAVKVGLVLLGGLLVLAGTWAMFQAHDSSKPKAQKAHEAERVAELAA